MATSYSSNLALALPATGELSGTWGTTVNSSITNMLDEALGYQAYSATGGADTLTIPDGTTGVARSIYIQLNGTGGGSVAVPTTKTKMYFVFNNTASAITFKVTGQTGVSIPAAAKMALVSNGTDIIVAQNYFAALTLGAALPVLSGGTGVTTSTGTGNNVLSASPTLTGTVAGASLSLSSLTSGRVPYAGTAGLLQDSANLLFNGTTLTANTIGAFTLSGTVAGGGNQLNNVIIGTTTPLAGSFTTLSATGDVTGGNGSTQARLIANSSAAQFSDVLFQTASLNRWAIEKSGAESGSNAGGDLYIYRYSDAGGYLGNPLTINRASGLVTANTSLAVTGTLSATGTLSGGTSGTGYSFSGSAPAGSLTLDASGNLGIGMSPARRLDVTAATGLIGVTSSTGTNYAAFQALNTGGTMTLGLEGSSPVVFSGSTAYSAIFGTGGAYSLHLATNNTVRATIDSSGDLLVGTASRISVERFSSVTTGDSQAAAFKNDSATRDTQVVWNAATSGNNAFATFYTETSITSRGGISYNRGAGLVVYSTTSDYRAKDIIGPVQNPGATIDALKVYEGQMKGATQSRPMLIAHEAQAVTPYSVTGEKDAVNEDGTPKHQQMDVSALVPLLLAELQSLRARVAQLESKP